MPFLNRVRKEFKYIIENNKFVQVNQKLSQKLFPSINEPPLSLNSKLSDVSKNSMIIKNPVANLRDMTRKRTTKNYLKELDFTL
jgi:hypothetical protein